MTKQFSGVWMSPASFYDLLALEMENLSISDIKRKLKTLQSYEIEALCSRSKIIANALGKCGELLYYE